MSRWLLVLAAFWLTPPPTVARDVGEPPEPDAVARFEATFASIGKPIDACEDTQLFFKNTIPPLLPADLRTKLGPVIQEFSTQLEAIKQLKKRTGEARKEMRLAILRVLRLVEESTTRIAADYEAGEYLNALWRAAELRYNAKKAEDEALNALIVYYWWLWDLSSAQQSMRTAAAQYYQIVKTSYPALPAGEREKALAFFRKRNRCLIERRKQVFCVMAKDQREFWKNLNNRAWSTVVGDIGWSPTEATLVSCGIDPAPAAEIREDPVAELADAFLSNVMLAEEYAVLAPETIATADILSTLLDREEFARRNTELNNLIDQALNAGLTDEAEWLVYQPMSEQLRMEVFRMRVERAQLALDRKLVGLEAAYRRQTSVMLGFSEALVKAKHQTAVTFGVEGDTLSRAWQQGQFAPRGLASSELMKSADPALKVFALIAITQKLLGDSMGLLITTPLQDALVEVAFKPVWGLFGQEVKTSVEKSWDQHKKQADDLKRQQALLADLLESIQTTAAATPYVAAMARGQPNASPIGQRAPTTLRSLLEDSDFVSATQGGLPWLFEAFCDLESQRAALLLHGAYFQLEANARQGALRVAAMRGLPVENPDLKLTRDSFQKIFQPGKPPPGLMGSSDQLLNLIPVVGALWQLYNLPRKIREMADWLYGNIQDQDDYLRALVKHQESFQRLLGAMAAVDFDYSRLQRERMEVYKSDHMALLNGSSEYANAYRLIRYHEMELEKRLVVVRHRDPKRKKLTSRGKSQLTGIQSRQDMDSADLAVRAAYAKLVYHVYTANYAAAAAQTRSLETLEAQKRKIFDLQPRTVDLSGVTHALEAEVVRRELVEIYRGLYETAIKDVVLSLATHAMADTIVGSVTEWGADVDPSQKLYEQLNPWAGLFTEQGVFNTLQNGFEGAAKSTTAQVLARQQYIFTEAQIEGGIDLVYGIGKDVRDGVKQRRSAGTPEQVLDRNDSEAREEALRRGLAELEYHHQSQIEPLLRRIEQIADDPDADSEREQIAQELARREKNPHIVLLRQKLAAIAADAADSEERRLEAEEEEEEAAVQIAAEYAVAEARNRMAAAADDTAKEETAAHAAAAAEALSRLNRDSIEVEDIQRLTSHDDPVNLRSRLLSPELDIVTIRSALKRAKKNHPDRAAEIDAVARDIDQRRIELVQNLIEDFMNESGLGSQVVAIVQGGAAEGNPEYQGIFGDIDFTVFVVPGASDNDIKNAILAYFKKRGFPLATNEEQSPMDTETFVQPAGRLEARETPYQTLVLDVAVKRKDATRFFSEGGGKWAMNNYAYSGKQLWGNVAEIRRWTRVEPREGYGLALDMARHLGFISDPRNNPGTLARMPVEQKIQQLGGVLKDSKYFLRLVDAYLMGHDGLGNELYNNRMQWRQDQGEDASYHVQIAKDVEALVSPGGGNQAVRLAAVTGGLEGAALESARRSIFTEADLKFVRMLAAMKQKGKNPDPWAVIEGDTPEAKTANAAELAAWMQEMGPRILAEAADGWQREYERVMAEGNPDAIRQVRTDARRISTTAAAADIYDVVGAKAMLRPPARIIERQGEDGRTRTTYQRLTKEEHLAELFRGIQADRQRRQGMLDEIAARQAAVRSKYPPEEEMTDAERAAVESEMKAVYDLVQGRAQNADDDNPVKWLMFWMRR